MEHSKCKICGEKHALGGCPEFKALAAALGQARAMAKINPFEDAARGRDSAPKSSGGSRVEDNPRPHGASPQQGVATSSKPAQGRPRISDKPSRGKGSVAANVAKPQIEPASALPQSPPEAKRKRAPRGTFDRNAYQREYMRKRRTPGKK